MPRHYPVFVAIDASNLYHGCRATFGPETKVDYSKLRDLLLFDLHKHSATVTIEAVVYTVETAGRDGSYNNYHPFLRMLEKLGYVTDTLHVNYAVRGATRERVEWSAGIAHDVCARVYREDPIKRFVLVSGHGNFATLVNRLGSVRVPTDVYSFEKSLSADLMRAASSTHLLEESVLLEIPEWQSRG